MAPAKPAAKAKGVDIALTTDMLSNAFLGNYDVAVLVAGDGDYVPLVEQAFGGERLLARVDNLTALTLRLNPDTQKTPGIYHAVLKKLAWDKISVTNMMCTFSELTILLEQSQTAPAFSVLSKIVSH